MKDINREALVDKLCERLAVEEGGVRIYDALLARLGGDAPIERRLQRFRQQEAEHCELLARYLDALGVERRDTPSARMARLEGEAYLKLIGEAESTPQLLHVLLTVELMDETAWELLVNLGRDLGDEEMVASFDRALREEKEHLQKVRGLVASMMRAEIESVGPSEM